MGSGAGICMRLGGRGGEEAVYLDCFVLEEY